MMRLMGAGILTYLLATAFAMSAVAQTEQSQPGAADHARDRRSPDGRAIFTLDGKTEDGWPVEARFLEVKDGSITEHSIPLKIGDVPYHGITGVYGCRLAQCGQPDHTGAGAASLAQVMDWLKRHGIIEEIARQLVERMQANIATHTREKT